MKSDSNQLRPVKFYPDGPAEKLAEDVKRMSFEELKDDLNKYSSNRLFFLSQLATDHSGARNEFNRCIADCRVGKLYQMLELKSEDEADRECQKLFREKLDELKSNIKQNKQRFADSEMLTHGVCTALFLSIEFCDLETADEQLCEWMVYQQSRFKRNGLASQDPKRWTKEHREAFYDFERLVGPGLSTSISLYACMMAKQGKSFDEIKEEVSKLLKRRNCVLPPMDMANLNDGEFWIDKEFPRVRKLGPILKLGELQFRDEALRVTRDVRELVFPPGLVVKGTRKAADAISEAYRSYSQQWLDLLQQQGLDAPEVSSAVDD